MGAFEWLVSGERLPVIGKLLPHLRYSLNRERYARRTEYALSIHDYDHEDERHRVARAEIAVSPFKLVDIGVGLRLGGSEDKAVTVSLNLFGSSVYVTTGYGRFNHPSEHYGTHLTWYESSELISFSDWGHRDDNEWPMKRWRLINWSRLVLGDRAYSSRVIEERVVEIPLPERSYKWNVRIAEDTWKRPRWPFASRIMRVHADCLDGEQIPVPGKGENSWDCDEDATFGLTTAATSIDDAIAKIADSATRTRLKYGGQGWVPEKYRAKEGA